MFSNYENYIPMLKRVFYVDSFESLNERDKNKISSIIQQIIKINTNFHNSYLSLSSKKE